VERKGEIAIESKQRERQNNSKIFAPFWRHTERAPTARFQSQPWPTVKEQVHQTNPKAEGPAYPDRNLDPRR
jgi:hypothetical protein